MHKTDQQPISSSIAAAGQQTMRDAQQHSAQATRCGVESDASTALPLPLPCTDMMH